ncbi:MAG: serine hydrolase, partial [Nocardioides sp.]
AYSHAMRLLRRIVLGLIALLLVALVGAYWWQRPLLLTATGYAAHNACAVKLLAGRDDPETDLPPNPLVPYLRTKEVDADGDATNRTIRGSIFGLLAGQQAHYTEGYGCTVGDKAPALPTPAGALSGEPSVDIVRGPHYTDEKAALDAAIAKAFGDDLSEAKRKALGTRGIVVMHGGDVVAERYADGFDVGTRQLGWSMTKSVTNLMVGRLVAEGKVSLDDDRLRKEWTDERADITIDDLLRMTSGLSWDETYALGTPITRMLYLEPDMGAYVASQKAAHRPGTYQQYSSGSTTLLCDILQDKTGLGADLPVTTLFKPLGLTSAVLEPDAAGTPVCSSYMWATPRDWAKVGQFALEEGKGEGRLLPQGWMAASTTVVGVDTTEEEGYAAGWWVNAKPDGTLVYPELPADAYFAEGHDGQWLVVVPSADLVVTRLGFSPEIEDEGVIDLVAATIAAFG